MKISPETTGVQFLTWDVPETTGGQEITNYRVEKLGQDKKWVKFSDVPVKSGESILKCDVAKDLKEGDQFRVIAENVNGPSEPSLPAVAKDIKPKATVPGKPEDVKVKEINETFAVVDWSPPKSDGGSPILSYKVEYKSPKDTKWTPVKEQVKSDGELTFKVDGLKPGSPYQFKVTAVNEVGAGQPSDATKPIQYGNLNIITSHN